MRILWLDRGSEHPWVEQDAWSYVEQSGFTVTKVKFPVEAREQLQKSSFDLLVVRAEVDGALRLLEEVKCHSTWSKRTRVIVISSKWKKEDFEEHAKMFIAADKYLTLPQPKVMFVQTVREVMGAAVAKPSALPFAPSTVQDAGPESSSRLDEIFSQSAGVPPGAPGYAPSLVAAPEVLSLDSFRAPDLSVDLPAGKPYEYQKPGSAMNRVNENTGPIFVSTPLQPSIAKNEQDVEVIRKYLHMREDELALALGEREELSRENRRLQKENSVLHTRLREVEHSYEEMSRKVIYLEKLLSEGERTLAMEKESREIDQKNSSEKNKFLEIQLSTANERYEELKNRVRKDIRKIRIKERDLEAKLEIARRDTEALIGSRDKRVLEMQRKIDALEFDLDQVQDSRIQAESEAERYLAKLSRVARALNLAIGMIEEENAPESDEQDQDPLLGGAALEEDAAGAEMAHDLSPAPVEPYAHPVETPSDVDELAALANDGEPTRVGSFQMEEADTSEKSQVISDDDEKAIG